MFLAGEYVAKDGRRFKNGVQVWPPREVKFTANTFGEKLAEKWCIEVTTELKIDEDDEGPPGSVSSRGKSTPKPSLGGLGALKGMLKKPKVSSPAPEVPTVSYDDC